MTTTTNWEKKFEAKFGRGSLIDDIEDFIRSLLAKQRSELLDQVEKEVIGEDENFLLQMAELRVVIDHDHWDYAKKFLKDTIETRNGLRYKQRQKLSALRLSVKEKK